MYGIVYMTTCLVDGRKYIGQHKCKTVNDSYLGSGTILKYAIQQYGRENFIRQTLCVCESKEELDKKEIEWIAKYDATNDHSFYNLQEGGSVNSMPGELNPMYGMRGPLAPAYGTHRSPEIIEQMSKRVSGENNPMYGRVYTEEERKKIGDRQRGEKHWNYGNHWSEEVKKKMSLAKLGKPSKLKGTKRSAEFCEKISVAKKGKKPNLSEETRRKKSDLVTKRNHTEKFKQQVSDANRRFHDAGGRRGAKPVVCIETNIVYASGYDAARAIGSSPGLVSACISGSQKTAKGYHWRLATEEEAKRAVIA